MAFISHCEIESPPLTKLLETPLVMDDDDYLHEELIDMRTNIGVKVAFESQPLADFGVVTWKARKMINNNLW